MDSDDIKQTLMSESPGRRSLDVDPAVQLFVRDEVTDTRHRLVNEISALSAKLELFAAQSAKEHGEVAAKLDRLASDVADLKPLAAEVAALKLADATAEARELAINELRDEIRSNRRDWRNWIPSAVSAGAAAAAVIIAVN